MENPAEESAPAEVPAEETAPAEVPAEESAPVVEIVEGKKSWIKDILKQDVPLEGLHELIILT